MKLKAFIGSTLIAVILLISSPILALSLGVSPTQVELEVPSNGSVTTTIQIHYFDGDVQISLIDIPLRIEPEVISVEASDNPVEIELTIYGDSSLGSKVYDGYIRFIAVSGGAATGGVQVIAKITNIVEGEGSVIIVTEEPKLIEDIVTDIILVEEEGKVEEVGVVEETVDEAVETIAVVPLVDETKEVVTEETESNSFTVILVALIVNGILILITLILVIFRRYQY